MPLLGVILLSENISRPTAQNMGAAARPRDGCEAYFHYREDLVNVKRVTWSLRAP